MDFSNLTIHSFFNNVKNDFCNNDLKWKNMKADKPYSSSTVNPTWGSSNKNFAVPSMELTELVEGILKSGTPRTQAVSPGCSNSQVVVVDSVHGPTLKNKTPRPMEHLQLTLQETFFLTWALGKLDVVDESGSAMSLDEIWTAFREAECNFVPR